MPEKFIREPYASREEWLEKRGHGIGGSDASCIIGENPYKTNLQLYQEKLGLIEPIDIGDKPYVRYGNLAEDHIRELFRFDYEYLLKVEHTNELLIRNDKPHIRGSLDGELEVIEDFSFMSYWKPYYNKNMADVMNIVPEPITLLKGMKGILEIKTTEVVSSMHKEKWHNEIPMNYYVQCLYYLLVTGYDFVILRAKLKWVDLNGVVTHEIRDYGFLRAGREKDLEFLEKEADVFWFDNIQKKIEPPLKIKLIGGN